VLILFDTKKLLTTVKNREKSVFDTK